LAAAPVRPTRRRVHSDARPATTSRGSAGRGACQRANRRLDDRPAQTLVDAASCHLECGDIVVSQRLGNVVAAIAGLRLDPLGACGVSLRAHGARQLIVGNFAEQMNGKT